MGNKVSNIDFEVGQGAHIREFWLELRVLGRVSGDVKSFVVFDNGGVASAGAFTTWDLGSLDSYLSSGGGNFGVE